MSRVRERLDRLYALGGGDGANRPGLGPEEEAAHLLVEGWMREAGLTTSRDAAGNLFGRLVGREPGLAEIWIGSHLDTVPRGGRFDGALGVVAAVEAMSRCSEPLARTVAVVAFRDEEGWRFGEGFFGSRAATGTLPRATLDRRDAAGVSVAEALQSLGLDPEGALAAAGPLPNAYIELHIEQGPVLAAADAAAGVVSSIVGLVEFEMTFEGSAGHAGTTPMAVRRDAGLCAAGFQVSAAMAVRAIPDAVTTVGTLSLFPGASNVIPERAHLVVEARAPDDDRVDTLDRVLRAAAARAAAEHDCTVTIVRSARTSPVASDPRVLGVLRGAAPDAPVLPSGAGHDAQILGAAGVPVGMVFVRSLAGGVSHSPLEDTADADVEAGVNLLVRALPALGAAL